jgi:hypothetical protein
MQIKLKWLQIRLFLLHAAAHEQGALWLHFLLVIVFRQY